MQINRWARNASEGSYTIPDPRLGNITFDVSLTRKTLATHRPYKPYIPQSIGEIIDHLGSMMIFSPTFEDHSGYLPGRNIDTTFFELNEGLKVLRKKLGEERYAGLVSLSDRMRAHFEADPENKTDDTLKGRALIHEMEDLLTQRKAKAAKDEE